MFDPSRRGCASVSSFEDLHEVHLGRRIVVRPRRLRRAAAAEAHVVAQPDERRAGRRTAVFAPGSGIGSRRPPMKSCASAAAAVPMASSSASDASDAAHAAAAVTCRPSASRISPRLQRQLGDELLELRGVLLRVHAVSSSASATRRGARARGAPRRARAASGRSAAASPCSGASRATSSAADAAFLRRRRSASPCLPCRRCRRAARARSA